MIGLLRRVQERIELSCLRRGVAYPWWIPAYSTLASVILTAIAFGQRDVTAPLAIAAFVLSLVPIGVWLVSALMLPSALEAAIMTGAVALYLTRPASPDFAPMLCAISAGEIAATAAVGTAVAIAAIEFGVIVVAHALGQLHSTPLYLVGVILGVAVGISLRWQMRALSAERVNTAITRDRAMLAERQRIAQEVHDVVGHSLAITLLHVTGARHSLQRHGDVADAVESLTEAEQVGRAAMADLRRTVGMLAAGPNATPSDGGKAEALPGLDNVAELVERARLAGLDTRFEGDGALCRLSDAAGLGVYRIVQESLANIAKHAPGAATVVRIVCDADGMRLSIRNSLPPGYASTASPGSGLPGMAMRAEQMGARLRTGVDGDGWLVDLIVPLASSQVEVG